MADKTITPQPPIDLAGVRADIEDLWHESAEATYPHEQCDDMWAWLCAGDFFSAPASMSHHGSCPGGLAAHSLNVAREAGRLARLQLASRPDGQPGEPLLVEKAKMAGLLHDICKVGLYRPNDGTDPKRPPETHRYLIDREQARRHGTLSRAIVHGHMPAVGTDVLDAIEWHMGVYDSRLRLPDLERLPASRLVSTIQRIERDMRRWEEARKRTPLVDIVHLADTIAARLMEE